MPATAQTPGIASNCLFYFIHLNENGLPIPGTMFAKNNNKLDPGYRCREGRLPATQMVVPSGKRQCFGKNHMRYFYRVNSITRRVVPNSFFQQIGKPKQMCQGTSTILEYIIYS